MKSICKALFILGSLMLCLGDAAASDVQARITLLTSATVRAPAINLSEIAAIQTSDPVLRERLNALELGDVPALTASKAITSYKIKSILEKENIAGVEISGTQSIVTTEKRELQEAEIRSFVEGWIRSQTADGAEVEITFESTVGSLWVPVGEGVELSISKGRKELSGNVTLPLQATLGGKVCTTLPVKVTIAPFKNGCVTHFLKRGEKITSSEKKR